MALTAYSGERMNRLMVLPLFFLTTVFWQGSAFAQPLPMVYEAVTLASPPGSNQTLTAVVPRSVALSFPHDGTPDEQTVMTIFDRMRTRFPAAYGSTVIKIHGSPRTSVTITLDQSRKENWPLVLAELYYTLKSMGFGEIRAPLFLNEPLGPLSIDAIVMLPAQPWFRATGADSPGTALVIIDDGRMMTAGAFRRALSDGTPEIVAMVAAGMKSPDEVVRLAATRALALTRAPALHSEATALLKDGSTAIRRTMLDLAARGMTAVPDQDLVRVADSDPEPELRLMAARILSTRGNHAYDHVLELSNLQSADPAVVLASLRRLGQSGRADMAPAVARTLWSGNAEVRRLAVQVLARLGSAEAMSRALASGNVPSDVAEALAIETVNLCPMDATALGWLAGRGGTESAARAIATACDPSLVNHPASCGQTAPPLKILATVTARDEQPLRKRAVECLGNSADPAALDVLMPLLTDAVVGADASSAASSVMARQPQSSLVAISTSAQGKDRTRRLLALQAMSLLPPGSFEPFALTALKGLMKDPDQDIRRAATNALAVSGDPSVCEAMLGGIDDQDEGIRRAAVLAAAGLSGPAAEAVLRRSLEDLSTSVRIAGLEVLTRRQVPETRARIRILAGNARPEVRRLAVRAWLNSLAPSEEALIFPFVSSLLFDSDEEIRVVAVTALRDMNDTQTANAVGALVIDQSPRVREAVAFVLGRMRTDAALGYLRRLSSDQDASVRLAVVNALGRFGSDQAGPILKDMLGRESDDQIRTTIGELLAR